MSHNNNIKDILRAIGLTPEEALAEIINVLSEETKIKMFSEVDIKEVERISLMLSISERYKVEWLKSYIFNELQLRVSNKRQGRKEFAEILGAKFIEAKKTIIEKIKPKGG